MAKTKKRRKAGAPTVYTSASYVCEGFSKSLVIRMALHPLSDAPLGCSVESDALWPFRVVWRYGEDAQDSRWAVSYRGRGFKAGDETRCIVGEDVTSVSEQAQPGEDVDANAIAWLLAGEEDTDADAD